MLLLHFPGFQAAGSDSSLTAQEDGQSEGPDWGPPTAFCLFRLGDLVKRQAGSRRAFPVLAGKGAAPQPGPLVVCAVAVPGEAARTLCLSPSRSSGARRKGSVSAGCRSRPGPMTHPLPSPPLSSPPRILFSVLIWVPVLLSLFCTHSSLFLPLVCRAVPPSVPWALLCVPLTSSRSPFPSSSPP